MKFLVLTKSLMLFVVLCKWEIASCNQVISHLGIFDVHGKKHGHLYETVSFVFSVRACKAHKSNYQVDELNFQGGEAFSLAVTGCSRGITSCKLRLECSTMVLWPGIEWILISSLFVKMSLC